MLKTLSHVLAAILLFGAALSQATPSIAAPAHVTRTSDEAGVRVNVTPKMMERDAKVWEFEVVLVPSRSWLEMRVA